MVAPPPPNAGSPPPSGTAGGKKIDLYTKDVRSSAPSRRRAAGNQSADSSIPEDAIPDVHVPGFVESLLGGPIVQRTKFLRADSMVRNLQLLSYIILGILGILTYIVNPVSGTMWFALLNGGQIAVLIHTLIIVGGIAVGGIGIMKRDQLYLLISYVLFIITALRFASSDLTLSQDIAFLESEMSQNLLVIGYAISLVLFFELSNGVLRFSMLDTSIRTNEVYVMNIKKVAGKYRRSLIINPLMAGAVAWFALSFNTIIPTIASIFSADAALRLEESVELTSVYGVALGTLIVFLVVGLLFAIDLPSRINSWRESRDS